MGVYAGPSEGAAAVPRQRGLTRMASAGLMAPQIAFPVENWDVVSPVPQALTPRAGPIWRALFRATRTGQKENRAAMKIYLATSVAPPEESPVPRELRGLVARDKFGVHKLADSPDAADLILFVDNHMNPDWRVRSLLAHPLLKRFPEKCMVYDERDHPWNALPGVYVSMPAEFFDTGSQRAWAYQRLPGNATDPSASAPDLLYSFMGTPGPRTSGGHATRREIVSLRDDRALIEDTSGFVFYDDRGDPAAHAARQRRFAETIGRSKFVLCPRGAGTSSFRMYEVMRAGRVPVIIADQWVAPTGPDWNKFSLRVPQDSVNQIRELLRQREPEWEGMAASAAAAYHQWFAPDVNFHNIIEQCRSIMEAGLHADVGLRLKRYRELRRHHAVVAARTLVGRALRKIGVRR